MDVDQFKEMSKQLNAGAYGFQNQVNLRISGIQGEFIERINDTIHQNLDNSSFGGVDLAKSINLSTSHFYRKFKLITGQNPNPYIRNYRLRIAAKLLSNNPEIRVKTVMYDVGFESASHFCHAFKKKYGLSPSDWLTGATIGELTENF